METMKSCPECGAKEQNERDCYAQLTEVLGWEAHDPELQRAHFLTVASYNLQHPAKFTAEAIAGLRSSVADYLDGKLTTAQIRERNSRAYNGPKRLTKPAAERVPVFKEWAMTIADVHAHNHPEGAAERVRMWAGSIIKP